MQDSTISTSTIFVITSCSCYTDAKETVHANSEHSINPASSAATIQSTTPCTHLQQTSPSSSTSSRTKGYTQCRHLGCEAPLCRASPIPWLHVVRDRHRESSGCAIGEFGLSGIVMLDTGRYVLVDRNVLWNAAIRGMEVPYGSSFEREIRSIDTFLLPLLFSLREKSRTPILGSSMLVKLVTKVLCFLNVV